jgi:hypothetical protein
VPGITQIKGQAGQEDTMSGKGSNGKKPKQITIEIDGEDFQVEDREMTVAELLGLVDLDIADAYLIELHGEGRQEKHESGDETIKLHNRERFVTGDRAPAPVA